MQALACLVPFFLQARQFLNESLLCTNPLERCIATATRAVLCLCFEAQRWFEGCTNGLTNHARSVISTHQTQAAQSYSSCNLCLDYFPLALQMHQLLWLRHLVLMCLLVHPDCFTQ